MAPDLPCLALAIPLLQHVPETTLNTGGLATGLVLFVLLLLASALFSGSEVALFSLKRAELDQLALETDSASVRVLRLLKHPRQLLISILILNTVVNVGAAILAAIMTGKLAAAFSWSPSLVLLTEVIVLTYLLLIVSEITPKLIATRHAVQYSRRISRFLLVLHSLMYPLSNLLARSMKSIQGRFKPSLRPLSGDDLKAMAEIGEAHGTLEEEERALIHSIVEFGEMNVREIMVSRLDIVAIPAGSALEDVIRIIRENGHSRMPLYVEHLDNILGIIYAKDLLRFLDGHLEGERLDLTRLARRPMFVPLGKKLDDLLRDFQSKKTHIAICVDEYGGTAGLVTLEDVLEEIVGDIRDEHDESEEELVEQIDETTYRCHARIDLDDLNDLLGLDLDTESFDFETLGGLIFHLTGAIPSEGDEVTYGSLHLLIETIESNRLSNILVRIVPPPVDEEISENDARGAD